jgi:hypothetical protein
MKQLFLSRQLVIKLWLICQNLRLFQTIFEQPIKASCLMYCKHITLSVYDIWRKLNF